MGNIIIEIHGMLGGKVHAYRQLGGTGVWQDSGVSTAQQTNLLYNIGDRFRFVAEPAFYQSFVKYTDASGQTSITSTSFEGEVVTETGTLHAYFDPNWMVIGGGVLAGIITYSLVKKK